MRTIILDCNNIGHIQRNALGQDLSWQDEETGVMWGFMRTLLGLSKQFDTNKFIFCWDARATVRKEMYPEYKANRHKGLTPDEEQTLMNVWKQFRILRKEILPAIGFKNVFHVEGFEADDIIAYIVRDYDWDEMPVVVSTDKDLYQLLHLCDIYRPLPGDKKMTMTLDGFRKEYEIHPDQWLEVKALMGDSGDNIPGLDKVGPKTAIKFLTGKLKTDSKVHKLIESKEGRRVANRNRELMILPHLDFPVLELRSETPYLDAFIIVCERYGFNSFLRPDSLEDWRSWFNLR